MYVFKTVTQKQFLAMLIGHCSSEASLTQVLHDLVVKTNRTASLQNYLLSLNACS